MVRTLLEYANSIWSPRRVCDVTKIDKVQMKAKGGPKIVHKIGTIFVRLNFIKY